MAKLEMCLSRILADTEAFKQISIALFYTKSSKPFKNADRPT